LICQYRFCCALLAAEEEDACADELAADEEPALELDIGMGMGEDGPPPAENPGQTEAATKEIRNQKCM
jgi:hypothetical protein